MTRFNIYWQALLKPIFATLEFSKFQELVTEAFSREETVAFQFDFSPMNEFLA